MGKLTDGLVGNAAQSVDLRAWCDEQNAKRISERMDRWYYVTQRDGMDIIDTLTGTDGGNVRKVLNGTLEDFAGWAPARMDGYRRWLWSCAANGLIEPPRVAHYEREAAE